MTSRITSVPITKKKYISFTKTIQSTADNCKNYDLSIY